MREDHLTLDISESTLLNDDLLGEVVHLNFIFLQILHLHITTLVLGLVEVEVLLKDHLLVVLGGDAGKLQDKAIFHLSQGERALQALLDLIAVVRVGGVDKEEVSELATSLSNLVQEHSIVITREPDSQES